MINICACKLCRSGGSCFNAVGGKLNYRHTTDDRSEDTAQREKANGHPSQFSPSTYHQKDVSIPARSAFNRPCSPRKQFMYVVPPYDACVRDPTHLKTMYQTDYICYEKDHYREQLWRPWWRPSKVYEWEDLRETLDHPVQQQLDDCSREQDDCKVRGQSIPGYPSWKCDPLPFHRVEGSGDRAQRGYVMEKPKFPGPRESPRSYGPRAGEIPDFSAPYRSFDPLVNAKCSQSGDDEESDNVPERPEKIREEPKNDQAYVRPMLPSEMSSFLDAEYERYMANFTSALGRPRPSKRDFPRNKR